jgi:EAL domain-containing protein (putative c-di-GMP-specific phosphodiesterase class I)
MPCIRCEQLPALERDPGNLVLWFPLGHSSTKAIRALADAGFNPVPGADGQITCAVDDGRPERAAEAIAAQLTTMECDDTRCLYKIGNVPASMADVPQIRSLTQLLRLYGGEWFLSLLAENRLTSVFQPIVRADDRTAVFGQEALARGKSESGETVSPGKLFDEARNSGLLFNLDLACRRSAIASAKRRGLGVGEKVFVNFTPTSIYDPTYCLRSTMAAVDDAGIPHGNVVFEVIESERTSDTGHLRTILAFYRGAGFQVALDDVGAGYSSLNLIHQLRPDYAKLDMELIRGVDQDKYKAVVAAKLLESARELGIETIAEGIETEGELAWCRDNGATFVQGYLIGKPG